MNKTHSSTCEPNSSPSISETPSVNTNQNTGRQVNFQGTGSDLQENTLPTGRYPNEEHTNQQFNLPPYPPTHHIQSPHPPSSPTIDMLQQQINTMRQEQMSQSGDYHPHPHPTYPNPTQPSPYSHHHSPLQSPQFEQHSMFPYSNINSQPTSYPQNHYHGHGRGRGFQGRGRGRGRG